MQLRALIGALSLILASNAAAGGATGVFYGTVRDGANGRGLPGARIILDGSAGGGAGTGAEAARDSAAFRMVRTDSLGRFLADSLPVGGYMVEAGLPGYRTETRPNSRLGSGRPEELNFALTRRDGPDSGALELQGKTVMAKGQKGLRARAHENVGTYRVTQEDIYSATAGLGDVSRLIQTLPGVLAVNDAINDLIVRGGGPGENSFLLDGIPALKVNHYAGADLSGGRIGNLNLFFMDGFSFHNGAFSARYPDKLSSVTEVDFRDGNTVRHGAMAALDMAGTAGMLEGPIRLAAEPGSYAATFRYSTLALLSDMGIVKHFGRPDYMNGHIKLYQPLGASRLKFNLIGATDHNSLVNPTYGSGRIRESRTEFDSDNLIGGLTWSRAGRRTRTQAALHFNNRTEAVDIHFYRPDRSRPGSSGAIRIDDSLFQIESNREREGGAGLDQAIVLGRGYTIRIGTLNQYFSTVRMQDYGPRTVYLPALDTTITAPGRSFRHASGPNFQGAVYAELLYASDRFDADLGYRQLYDELTDEYGFGPRAAGRWHLSPDRRLKLGFGIHSQAQAFETVYPRADWTAAQLPFSRQTVAGYEQDLGHGILVSVEGYDKLTHHLPRLRQTRDTARVNAAEYRDSGKVSSRGIEIYAKKELTRNLFGSFTYNYGLTRERDERGQWLRNRYSVPHAFNASAGWDFRRRYTLSLQYSYASGAPYTPIDYGRSLWTGSAVLDESRRYGRTAPSFQRLDIRADGRWNYRRAAVNAFISVENVFNRENVFGYAWRERNQAAVRLTGFGILPIAGVSVGF